MNAVRGKDLALNLRRRAAVGISRGLMQRVVILFLVIFSAAASWWAYDLRGRLAMTEAELAALRADHALAKKAAELARAETEPLRANVARLTEERDRAKATAKSPAPADDVADAAKPEAKEANLFGGLLQSMDSPEMRKMMRGQAVTEAKKEYATLIKKWDLSPKDAEQFVQFVADRDFSDDSDALSFLKGGEVDEKKMAEMEKKEEARTKESSARLKALLGEQRLGELEKFDADKAQQVAVARYSDHLTSAGFAMDVHQQEELANILRMADGEDASKTPAQRKLEEAAVFTTGFTDESIAAARKKDEENQRRVVSRATGLLNPDQISALQTAFKEENDEKEMGMKFAAQMMKNGALKDFLPAIPEGKAEVKTQITIKPKLGK